MKKARATNRFDDAPDSLLKQINAGKCAVFVGAGVSAGSGFPAWDRLLLDTIQVKLESKDISQAHADEMRALLSRRDAESYLTVAQELSDRLSDSEFKRHIAKVFRASTIKPSSAHNEIVKKPFAMAMTTNYDKLVENAYAKKMGEVPTILMYDQASAVADAMWSDSFFLLKAHGSIEDPSKMIITERDYRNVVFRQPGYRSAISAIFTTRTVLFVGASLADPELKLLMSFIHDSFHGGGAEHYALLPRGVVTEVIRTRWKKDYKVQIITYEASPNHIEVEEFLKTLPNGK